MKREEKDRSDLPLCAGLFVLAAATRLPFLWATVDRDLPFSVFYYGDSRIYREFALTLLRGGLFDQGIPLHPPAFAYLLSWIIGLVGEHPTQMRAVIAVISSATVPLTYLLGRAIWDRRTAIVAATLATLSFGLCVTAVSPNVESIYIPILTAQVLLTVLLGQALDSGSRRRVGLLVAASGVLLGVGTLARAEHLGLAALIPIALALAHPEQSKRRIAGIAAAIAALAIVVTMPWALHNHEALTRFNAVTTGLPRPLPTWVGVSATGPLVFAMANNANADGTFRPDAILPSMGQGMIEMRDPAQLAVYLDGYRMGWSFLLGRPVAAANLLARKLVLASDAYALGFGLSNWPGGLAGTRRPVDVFVPIMWLWKPVALVLLAAGLFLSRTMLRSTAMLWLTIGFGVAVTLASFGYVRFCLQSAPIVFLFQSVVLIELWSRLRAPRARSAVVALGCLVVMALLIELAIGTAHPRNFQVTGSMDPANGKIVQDAAITLVPIN